VNLFLAVFNMNSAFRWTVARAGALLAIRMGHTHATEVAASIAKGRLRARLSTFLNPC